MVIAMDPQRMQKANDVLEQKTPRPSRRMLLMLIAILISIIVVVFLAVCYALDRDPFGTTYPYIPPPKNTLMSTSLSELPFNILMDANDGGVKYSVLCRTDLFR